MASERVSVRRLDPAEIGCLRPLWDSLREHHGRVAPELPPIRASEDSWRRRREQYARWLAQPGSFALVAEAGGEAVGYVLVRIAPGSVTWRTGERIAEIETLSVDPRFRGQRLGSRLMDAAEEELARGGISALSVAAVATNSDAVRFYERRGLAPWMIHFYGRPGRAGTDERL